MTAAQSRASTFNEALDAGVRLPQSPFSDTPTAVCTEPDIGPLSGITADRMAACDDSFLTPSTDAAAPPPVVAGAVLSIHGGGDRPRYPILRLVAGTAMFRRIGGGAFALLLLSLLVWHLIDTLPQSSRRSRTLSRHPPASGR